MMDQRTSEQAQAEARSKKWGLTASACIVSGSALSIWQKPLSKYLAAYLGQPVDTLQFGLYLLHVTWVLVAIFCMLRAHKIGHSLRCKAPNEKNWDEHKRKLEEDGARAEKYLGIER